MKTSSAGIKLIIFMVVTSLLTFVLAATIGNLGFGGSTMYNVQFTDAVGLLPGNEVRISGVKVGQVKKVALDKTGKVADVTLALDGDRHIMDGNVMELRYRNLVGERYVAIDEGTGSGKPLDPHKTIGTSHTRNALDLTVLFNGFRPLFQALDPQTVNQVSFEIVQTLQGEGGTIDTLLTRTASLTTTLADKDAVIGRVIDNLTTVLNTVDQRDGELNNLITELKTFSAGFAQDRVSIGDSIAGISDLTVATAGLIQDVRPPLQQDITRLKTLATNLDTGKQTINGILQRLPNKLNTIIGTATYGSWFNFYLCGVEVGTGSGSLPVQLVNSAPRCQT